MIKPPEHAAHFMLTDADKIAKLDAIKRTMMSDLDKLMAVAMHAAIGRGTCTLTIHEDGTRSSRYDKLEICPDSLRAWREHADAFAQASHDLCKLVGVE